MLGAKSIDFLISEKRKLGLREHKSTPTEVVRMRHNCTHIRDQETRD